MSTQDRRKVFQFRVGEGEHLKKDMVGGGRDFLHGFLNDSYITKQHTWFSYLKIKFILLNLFYFINLKI